MSPRTIVLWFVAVVLSGGALAFTGAIAAAAGTDARRAAADLRRLQSQAQELAVLHAAAASAPARPTAGSGLAARLASTLAAARLPATALAGVNPESATIHTGQDQSTLRRQRATVNLAGLTLPQLGSLLAAWRSAEPGWTVTRIDIAPLTGAPSPGSGPGGDSPLRIGLSLEALLDPEPVRGGGT